MSKDPGLKWRCPTGIKESGKNLGKAEGQLGREEARTHSM